MVSALTVFLVVAFGVSVDAQATCTNWGYLGGQNGMQGWSSTCSACNGTSQSPIDLNVNTAQSLPSNLSPYSYSSVNVSTNMNWTSSNFTLFNTGLTMQLLFDDFEINATGLALNGTFIAAQMHWHWGSNSSIGSEHTLSGFQFPMEGHLVMYNSLYDTFTAAVGQPNGLAVIGFWYTQNATTDNPLFAPIVNAATMIPETGDEYSFPGFNVMNLLPGSVVPYFRYYGSLTTPGCQQNVTWTVLNTVYSISANQMNIIRSSMYFNQFLTYTNYSMVNNYRSTLPLNGRSVYYYPAPSVSSTSSACLIVYNVWLLISLHFVLLPLLLRL